MKGEERTVNSKIDPGTFLSASSSFSLVILSRSVYALASVASLGYSQSTSIPSSPKDSRSWTAEEAKVARWEGLTRLAKLEE
jgi:hypothetical protein